LWDARKCLEEDRLGKKRLVKELVLVAYRPSSGQDLSVGRAKHEQACTKLASAVPSHISPQSACRANFPVAQESVVEICRGNIHQRRDIFPHLQEANEKRA